MLLTLICCTLFILLVSLLPLLRHPHWFIRGMDFPRLQFTILAVALLFAHLVFLDIKAPITQILLLVTTLCVVWQLWWILPFTFVWPKEVKNSDDHSIDKQLTILTSNVFTPNRQADALITLVKQYQPDVLVTLESDQWWQEQLKVIEVDMPYCVKCPLDNLYGMHVYSS